MSQFEDIPDEPLEFERPTTTSFPQIPAEMVASIALGMEDDLIIAARHGFSVEQYSQLLGQPFFRRAIEDKRSEFKKNGVTFKAKAAWMAEELLDKVYLLATRKDASFGTVHEALKTAIKAAGLEPKVDATQQAGAGFSISIDLGGGNTLNLSNSPSQTLPAPSQPLDITDVEEKK